MSWFGLQRASKLLQSRGGRFFLETVVLLVVLRSAAPSAAWAQVAPSPDVPAVLEQAREAEAAGRLTEAVGALEQAYEAGGDPELLFRLGELNSKLGQIVPALRLYRTYVSRDSSGKHRATAEQQICALVAAMVSGVSASSQYSILHGAVATGTGVYVNTREAGFSGIWRF